MDKIKNKNKQKDKGFALLFAIVIISILSAITAGLANTTLKQLIISSVAKDSQAAFFASDTATECAFYAYYHPGVIVAGSTWSCGTNKKDNTPYQLKVSGKTATGYILSAPDRTSMDPCFDIDSTTDLATGETVIHSNGYNFCNTTTQRSVQRTIKVTIGPAN